MRRSDSLHAFLRVVLAAVLDGVHQQFAEGDGDILAGLERQVGLDFAQEMGGAVGRVDLAADVQSDPLGPGGDHPDVVFPRFGLERLLHHFRQRARRERLVEVAVGAMANGAEDAHRVGLAGDDHLEFRPDSAGPAQQLQAVEPVAALAGHHQIEGAERSWARASWAS